MRLLQRFVPLSMRTRLILLVVLTTVAMQLTTWYWLSIYRRNHANTVALEMIAITVHTLQNAIEALPPEQRADFIKRASDARWSLLDGRLPLQARVQRHEEKFGSDTDGPEETINDVRRSLRGLVNRLKTELAPSTRIALSHGPHAELFISIATPEVEAARGRRTWLVIPINQIDPPVQTSLVWLWLTVIAALSAIALWFSWHVTRPITQLVNATDQLASGKPIRVKPSGPSETKILGERFNAMLDSLAASDSMRRTLLAGLPHDLKGPLSRMWLRIEMTEDLALKEGMRQDLQDMQRMTEQFISFLRGTDPDSYSLTPIPLDQWLVERVQTWQSAGSPVGLKHPPTPSTVMGDGMALTRLLDNLIDNALTHGLPPVSISLTCENDWAVLQVSDEGKGIPAERREEALEPFARLDNARTRSGNVGLGLALCVSIARAHAGSLSLGQQDSGGLIVEIRLQLKAPDQIKSDNPSS